MDAKDIRNLQEAYMEVYQEQELDEAEGSYGQTPKARQAMGKLVLSRQNKPASEYGKRGEKTKQVGAAEKQTRRQDALAKGSSGGKKSSRPWGPAGRGKMTADDREELRSRSVEYGEGGTHGEGGITKNPKKLRKQKAMGELGEQVDIYDIILSHLLDEGYAETPEAAERIMVNMSEEWRDSIVEERVPVRKRGGVSAPEGERSIGGQPNRRNKDYWASVEGGDRDRGAGSKAKRRAAKLG